MTTRNARKDVHDDFVAMLRRAIPDYFLERNRERALAAHLTSCEECRKGEYQHDVT